MIDVNAILRAESVRFEREYRRFLPSGESTVAQAMRYSLSGGGKRVRPALTMAFCELFGGAAAQAVPLAVAIEMVHCYSLIHDDLPCMDNDDYRRGRLSCHRQFGEQAALLAGDALLTQAFGVIAQARLSAEIRCKAVELLANAGKGMIDGQWLDLSHENKTMTRAQLEQMNAGKTGALIATACELGCLAASTTEAQTRAARSYSAYLGLLFQLTDDILDVTSSPETLGKSIGKDAAAGKNTWVSLLGLAGAKRQASEFVAQAQREIAPFATEDHLLYCLPGWLEGREN